MTTNVSLTPELERFAHDCIAEGRYDDISDVVRCGLRLLREHEQWRREFAASLREAEEEADRDGWVPFEEVRTKAQNIIDNRNK